MESLDSSRKVSEHQVEQLKNALFQLKNEAAAVRNELARTQSIFGNVFIIFKSSIETNCNSIKETKKKTLDQLEKSDTDSYAVFGEWVPKLVQRIQRTSFSGSKPKGPIGKKKIS